MKNKISSLFTIVFYFFRYLAAGDSMISLSYLFRLGKATVSNIISETLEQIWKILKPIVLTPPNEEKWREVAEGFKEAWHYPNCIGAIDGKHVLIQVSILKVLQTLS